MFGVWAGLWKKHGMFVQLGEKINPGNRSGLYRSSVSNKHTMFGVWAGLWKKHGMFVQPSEKNNPENQIRA